MKDKLMGELERRVGSLGGHMLKISVEEYPTFPEYMVILPGGRIGFVDPYNHKDDKKQERRIAGMIGSLRTSGCAAACIMSEEHIDSLLCYILSDAGKDPAWYSYREQRRQGDAL